MNKFFVMPCLNVKGDSDSPQVKDFEGSAVVLGCFADASLTLFFPIDESEGNIINYVLKDDAEYNENTNVLGIYNTMLESWKLTDRFLSGVIMDSVYDKKTKEESLTINLAISNDEGQLDCLVPVSFKHAILLAAMTGVNIIISNKLIVKLIPDMESVFGMEVKDNDTSFPEDKKLLKIAKHIMNGKIKGKNHKDNKDENDDADENIEDQ